MSPTAMEKLESQRASTKATLDWLQTKHVDHGVNPIDEETVDQYLQMVADNQKTVKEVHEKIVALNPADLTPHMVEYFDMLEKVHKLLSGLKGIKAAFPTRASTAGASIPGPTPRSTSMHLPKLQLPTFDGNIENWQSFHDMFRAGIISNPDLKNAQKLTYLKSLLTGEAAIQIKSIALTDDNFDIAWNQLQHRYDNKRELLFAILKKFTDQKCLVGNSGKALRNLIDVSNECFSSLTALNLPVDKWDAILLFHISSKLDNTTREMWEQTLIDTSIPTLKKLLKFLERRAGALAAGELSQPKFSPAPNPGRQGHGRAAHVHHVPASPTCNLCGESHYISRCPKFLSLTPQEKNETAEKFCLCFNCLWVGHSVANCPSRGTCRICQGKHHTLLHKDKPAAKQGRGPDPELVLSNHSREISRSQGMLATAVIKVRGQDGQFNYCRAFLDGGSTSSFITEACVRRLNLSRTPVSTKIRGLASTAIATAKGLVTLSIDSQFTGNPSYSVQALILPRVIARLPVHQCDASSWPHLKGLQLADPKFNQPNNIDMLLGADIFYNIFLNETRTGSPDCPTAIKTTLGWLVAGKINSKCSEVAVHYTYVDREEQLQKLSEIETVSTALSMTNEEQDCSSNFESTHKVNEHGKFIVRLPLKTSQPPLSCSRGIAVRRLEQLEGRFARVPERQVECHKAHTYLQRIVWSNSPTEPFKDSKLLTVTYGTGTAQFLATIALQPVAINNNSSLYLSCQAAMRHTYVCHLLSGSRILEQATEAVWELMGGGGRELRRGPTSRPALLDKIPAELWKTQNLLPLDSYPIPASNSLSESDPVAVYSEEKIMNPRNILRLHGRLRYAPSLRHQREPVPLPRHHHLTKLPIMSEHLMISHARPHAVLAHIQREFWIIRARDTTRHHINKSVRCIRVREETLQQFIGNFPAARVTPRHAPLKWKLGRVTALQPEDDALVRAAMAKTADCELNRHILTLCLLPVKSTTTADPAGPTDIDPQQQ